jgi:hypothetical protein
MKKTARGFRHGRTKARALQVALTLNPADLARPGRQARIAARGQTAGQFVKRKEPGAENIVHNTMRRGRRVRCLLISAKKLTENNAADQQSFFRSPTAGRARTGVFPVDSNGASLVL